MSAVKVYASTTVSAPTQGSRPLRHLAGRAAPACLFDGADPTEIFQIGALSVILVVVAQAQTEGFAVQEQGTVHPKDLLQDQEEDLPQYDFLQDQIEDLPQYDLLQDQTEDLALYDLLDLAGLPLYNLPQELTEGLPPYDLIEDKIDQTSHRIPH